MHLKKDVDMNKKSQVGARIVLIGAPTDCGAADLGASMGPAALRVAGLGEALSAMGFDVVDQGDLPGPKNPRGAMVAGAKNAKECASWMELARGAVAESLASGACPILMGGDHSLAAGSVAAAAAAAKAAGKQLRVVWLDAHADFNSAQMSTTGNLHGMPLAALCGMPVPGLNDAGGAAVVEPDQLRLIGQRSVDASERLSLRDLGVAVFDMRHIDEFGMRQAMMGCLDGLTDRHVIHVSFDVDFLDPSIAPGVGTAVRGGPTYREAQLCMEMLRDTGRVSSVDIMELNPALDCKNETAKLVVDLMESLFGKSTLWRE